MEIIKSNSQYFHDQSQLNKYINDFENLDEEPSETKGLSQSLKASKFLNRTVSQYLNPQLKKV